MRRREFLMKGGCAAAGAVLAAGQVGPQERAVASHSSNSAVSSSLVRELQGLIPKLMAEAAVPGSAVALVKGGRLIWRSGFGFQDSVSKQPVDENTIFEAASISKTVFAYAILKVCEMGKLDLDVPLTRYTKQRWLQGDPRLDLITARHILSHTSGFQDWRSGAEPLKIHFTPGTQFLYSGEGYSYLQSVLTELTGQVDRTRCGKYEAGFEVCATDIDSWLTEHVLKPCGMPASGYVWRESWEARAAHPHDEAGKPSMKRRPSATDAARYASAGGLHTTATEYAHFLAEIVDQKTPDPFGLSPALQKEMLRPAVQLRADQKIDGAGAWALGWGVQERPTGPVVVHSGGQRGFQCLTMASVERKSGFVFFTNSNNGWKICHAEAFQEVMNQLL